MGVLAPIVNRTQAMKSGPEIVPSDRKVTPANGLTVIRPILGLWAVERLVHGKKWVSPIVAAMAATDMEGQVARFISKRWPESGLGVSEFGGDNDVIADSAAVLEVSLATLYAPRVSYLGKSAVSTMLAQEGYKVNWARKSNNQYKHYVPGQRLVLPVTNEGKEAMAEKLVGVTLAVATGDTDNPALRFALGTAAMAFATAGSLRGERSRHELNDRFEKLIYQLENEADFSDNPLVTV